MVSQKYFKKILTHLTTILFGLVMINACQKESAEELNQKTGRGTVDSEIVAVINQAAAIMGQYRYQDTVTLLEPWYTSHPSEVAITLNLAIAILNRQEDGDIERAIALTLEVNKNEPENIQAKYIRGLLFLYQGKPENARDLLTEVTMNHDKDPYALYFLAQSYDQTREFNLAFEHYAKAIELSSNLRSALYGGAMAARRIGDKKNARFYLNQYKKLDNNPKAILAEFKYTRMGALAEVQPIQAMSAIQPKELPQGKLWHEQSQTVETKADSFALLQTHQQNALPLLVLTSTNETLKQNLLLQNRELTKSPHSYPAYSNSAWGDINNDGLFDVVQCHQQAIEIILQQPSNQWNKKIILDNSAGFKGCFDIKLIDADHDGDLDVYAALTSGKDELFSNNGDLTFRTLSALWDFKMESATLSIIPVDWDHDRDLDLVLLKETGETIVLINKLFWNYQKQVIELDSKSPIRQLLVVDNNSDGQWELLTYDSLQQLKQWSFQQSPANKSPENKLPDKKTETLWFPKTLATDLGTLSSLINHDLNGDGQAEVIVAGNKGLYWLEPNLSGKSQLEEKASSNLNQLLNTDILKTALFASSEHKGPGLIALHQTVEDDTTARTLEVFFPGEARFNFANIYLSGKEDQSASMRSNRQAIGVEARARIHDHWQVLSPLAAVGNAGQDIIPLMISTEGKGSIDYVELRWPDGVYQTELDVKSGTVKIEETQRQLSSCPVFFVKTEKGYQFVSDLLGVGGIGFLDKPGVSIAPRPWEYFLLPQNLIENNASQVSIQITEPMEENAYLDSVNLHRYRLPQGWQMVLDERMGVNAPLPTGEAVYYRQSINPIQAIDRMGENITNLLLTKDNNPAPVGALHQKYIGLLKQEQIIILFFDQTSLVNSADHQWGLVTDGWVEYPYSQTVFAAWQSGQTYQAPSFDIRVNGEWQLWREQMGYPAGMPRQSFFPLDRLPEGTDAIKIRSNLELYWDRITLVKIENKPEIELQTASLSKANLKKIGFPKRLKTSHNRPDYVFEERKPFADMKNLTGDYTRFGEVNALLEKEDDALAILGAGEAVSLEFLFENASNNKFDKISDGTTYYVLETRGYAKDMDLYTNQGGTVGPLPQKFSHDEQLNMKREKLHNKYNIRYQDNW